MAKAKYEGISKEAAWTMYAAGMEVARATGHRPPSVENAFKAGFDVGRCKPCQRKTVRRNP